MRILVVEDDKSVAEYIRKGLTELGHVPDITGDGKEGLFLATTEDYDAIVLDRMLPGLDGLALLNTLRASSVETPVVFLSAKTKVQDKIDGLKAGADDYLAKPFSFSELAARLEVVVTRRGSGAPAETKLTVKDLEIDLMARSVSRGGELIDLQPREYSLLEYLVRNKNQVVTRTMLLEHVWDYHFDPQTNIVDVHISRLRQKVALGSDETLIKTVRGAGYIVSD